MTEYVTTAIEVIDVFLRINGYVITADNNCVCDFMMKLFEQQSIDIEHRGFGRLRKARLEPALVLDPLPLRHPSVTDRRDPSTTIRCILCRDRSIYLSGRE